MGREAIRVIALEEHYADPELLAANGFDSLGSQRHAAPG